MKNKALMAEVKTKLVEDLDTIMYHYFHQTLDEVLMELRMRCIIGDQISDPDSILRAIYRSNLLNTRSDIPVVQFRKAVYRAVNGLLGNCSNCNGSIPDQWLRTSPTVEFCSKCMIQLRGMPQEEIEQVGYQLK
jgi:RNA polymerase-binding transcription factor DksA